MIRKSCSARCALLRTTAVAGVVSAAFSSAAFAQAGTYAFNIPAEPLSLALQDVAKTSGKQIVFADRLTTGKSTAGLHGDYTVDVAMNQLLGGTDLVVSQTVSGGLVVKPKNVQAAANNVGAAADGVQTADAGAASVESVVVTGSRVITNIANSPTPITSVSTDSLLKTTPIDIPNALNKLPVFLGSSTPSDPTNSSNGIVGNVLSLRNFGAQRTLVLLDGHRQAASNSNGTIDIDTLPQTLMERVDVVTGGASAVYGSNAITGVVNFVLNKEFEGLKVEGNAGISNFGDGAEQQISMAAGTSLFGGRGHLEGSLRYYHLDPILLSARPWGTPTRWTGVGAGTLAQPVQNVEFSTYNNFAFGGKISCTGCAANGQQFISNGVIGPFLLGQPTASTTVTSGGDGTYNQASDDQYGAVTYQAFSRFSYDITDDISAYVQVLAAQGTTDAYHVVSYIQPNNYPNQVFTTNAFLTSTEQALLANPSGTFTDTQYFQFPYYQGYRQFNTNRNLSAAFGLDGKLLGKYNWDLYYSHSENRLDFNNPYDESNLKLAAASDAVVNPANGQIVCQVSLTAYAANFPGCVPLNRFGPTAASQTQFNYILQDEQAITTQTQEDFSGSISGEVLDLPAGPVKAAIDGEYRRLSFKVASNGLPGYIDCTGLRLCQPSTPQTMHGITLGRATVSDAVWEFAGEVNAPLLKDLPLIQSLDLNLAGRYTDYRLSGAVQTWKIGLDYHVNDDIHLRNTMSVDIRAPTLFDLYAPANLGHTGFLDPHTGGQSGQVVTQSQGNPSLVPEVARTYTSGVVLTPSFIPGFQLSVDYYQIVLKNAISNISGTTSGVAQTCEASGGTSPLCNLFIRPLPFSNTSQANYPSLVLSETLNAARADTGGIDVEADYSFDLGDVLDSLPGRVDLRSLFSLQPYNKTSSFPGAPIQTLAEPKGRVTTFINYNLNGWGFDVEDRFYSAYDRSNAPGVLFYAVETGEARNYVDLTVSKTFERDGDQYEFYVNVQNLFNLAPPIEPVQSSVPGSGANGLNGSGGAFGADTVGRYYTIGFRAKL